jgi:hypothetical protein
VLDTVPGGRGSRTQPPPGTAALPNPWRLPLAAVAVYEAIRGLGLAVTVFLLPHIPIGGRHYTLAYLIHSWDASRYLAIASRGYHYVPGNSSSQALFAWYPGYPAAIDAFAWIPGLGPMRAAFLVTMLSGLAAAAGLALLAAKLTGSSRTGLLTAGLWAAAPGSLVFEMDYSEALVCAIAAWGLLALTSRRWLTAGLLAALAGTVRSVGAALIVAVAIAAIPELVKAIRQRSAAVNWWRPAVALVIAPLGLLGFLGYVALSFGRLDGWFYEEHVDGNGFDGGYSIAHNIGLLARNPPGPHVGPIVVVLAACALAVALTGWLIIGRRTLGGIPPSVLWYVATTVFVTLTSGPHTFGAKPRYLLPALLLGLPLAALLARTPRWVQAAVIAAVTVAAIWLSLYKMSPGWQA